MLTPDTILQSRYRMVCDIGQGGMGVVYEAVDLRLGHRVAVKELIIAGSVLRQAFQEEARRLAPLRHAALPNVSDHSLTDFFTLVQLSSQESSDSHKRR